MNLETRVGMVAVGVLKDFARQSIEFSYWNKDYAHLVHYINLYKRLEVYLSG